MSNRMEQMNKRICTMKQENKEIIENISNMRIFQKQFKAFEKDFRRKIAYYKDKAQGLLDKAVTAYEEKDEFTNKRNVFEERRAQDNRRIAVTENSLTLYLERAGKNEDFAKLQDIVRADVRIAETTEMIEKGITGLEPTLEDMQNLQSDIREAAGEDTVEKMEESFNQAGDDIDKMFSYLDELLRDIHHLQNEVDSVKGEIKNMSKNIRSKDLKLKKNIEINQDKAQRKLETADAAAVAAEDSKTDIGSILDVVKSLYVKCCPDDSASLDEKPIDESNVMDYLQNMEKQLLDYLICLEYVQMKEESDEEQTLVIGEEEDDVVDDGGKQLEEVDSIQPRTYTEESDLETLTSLDLETSILEFEDLKDKALAVIKEIQSRNSVEEPDDSK